jgi:hypothetical protein
MNYTNQTYDCPSIEESCIEYIVSLATVSSLFIVSEILPFLRGQNNGLADCLVKCFQGSECILSKLIDCLKKDKDSSGEVEVTATLNSNQEQKIDNNINININEKRETE